MPQKLAPYHKIMKKQTRLKTNIYIGVSFLHTHRLKTKPTLCSAAVNVVA